MKDGEVMRSGFGIARYDGEILVMLTFETEDTKSSLRIHPEDAREMAKKILQMADLAEHPQASTLIDMDNGENAHA